MLSILITKVFYCNKPIDGIYNDDVLFVRIIINKERSDKFREGANKQVISSQADSLIKISRIWADFFPANTSNQPI